MSDRHLFMAFSTYTTDTATFGAWYDSEHIPQVMSAPGLVGAQRFVLADTKPLPGVKQIDLGHLALYELDRDPGALREEVKRMLIGGDMVIPDFMVQPFQTLFLEPISEPVVGPALVDDSSLDDRHLFFAWSRHTTTDEEFGRWYDEEHIPQVASGSYMLRAQRFRVGPTKPIPGSVVPDLGHLALYEIAGDLGGFREDVKRMLISGEMVLPDFMIHPFGALFMRPASPWFPANAATVGAGRSGQG